MLLYGKATNDNGISIFLPVLIRKVVSQENYVSNAHTYRKYMLYEKCASIANAQVYAVQTGLCLVSKACMA